MSPISCIGLISLIVLSKTILRIGHLNKIDLIGMGNLFLLSIIFSWTLYFPIPKGICAIFKGLISVTWPIADLMNLCMNFCCPGDILSRRLRILPGNILDITVLKRFLEDKSLEKVGGSGMGSGKDFSAFWSFKPVKAKHTRNIKINHCKMSNSPHSLKERQNKYFNHKQFQTRSMTKIISKTTHLVEVSPNSKIFMCFS